MSWSRVTPSLLDINLGSSLRTTDSGTHGTQSTLLEPGGLSSVTGERDTWSTPRRFPSQAKLNLTAWGGSKICRDLFVCSRLNLFMQIWIWWSLFPDGSQGVHLWVLPASARVAATEGTHHPGGVWRASLRPLPVLPIPACLSHGAHEVRHDHGSNW